MIDRSRLIYLHGLESTSQSGKARRFVQKFPGMLTPDFTGSFEARMQQLGPILGRKTDWTIIGSSFGGLMAAVFAGLHLLQVRKLILLAPALMLPEFAAGHFTAIDIPTVLVHGRQDEVVPPDPIREIAQAIFTKLEYIAVDDDHRLQKAFAELDWDQILA